MASHKPAEENKREITSARFGEAITSHLLLLSLALLFFTLWQGIFIGGEEKEVPARARPDGYHQTFWLTFLSFFHFFLFKRKKKRKRKKVSQKED